MASTVIPVGSALAGKVFGAAVFADATTAETLTKNMIGPAPKIGEAVGKLEKKQTDPGYPIVQVTDLTKGGGDKVSVDLFHILQGLPVMGDEKMDGKLMRLTSSSQDVVINQMRAGVDGGGRMTQQRTVHDLRKLGRAALAGYWSRMMNQIRIVHLSGARGSLNPPRWHVPLETHADYAGIMVNSVLAPTYNRHLYAGDATGIDSIDTTDVITLATIDKLKTILDEADTPLAPVRMVGDKVSEMSPLALMLVTPRQWATIQRNTSGDDWKTFLASAGQRGMNNPLFTGSGVGMWNGILIRQSPDLIRFNPSSVVTVATSADTFTTTTVQVPAFTDGAVDRALILGAQALAEVWGKNSQSGGAMNWFEQPVDHNNGYEASVSAIGGCSKLRFPDSAGVDTDHGVFVLDSYAASPT